jgi:DNA mismatch endonuclease (patch repair protein)
MGYRYRLHRRDLPGTPDLTFPRLGKVIFMHGCFWHRHRCRAGQAVPKTRTVYWQAKFDYNVDRDRRNLQRLRRLGWRVLIVWECQFKNEPRIVNQVSTFLAK